MNDRDNTENSENPSHPALSKELSHKEKRARLKKWVGEVGMYLHPDIFALKAYELCCKLDLELDDKQL